MQIQTSTHPIVPGSAEHNRLITASKIGVIMGKDPYQTPAELWLRMNGMADPVEQNDSMLRGKILESGIIEWFFTKLHPELEQVAGETTLTRDDLPWAAANPDAIARHRETGELFVIDAKSVTSANADHWGKPGTSQTPEHPRLQVGWQMHMTHGFQGMQITKGFLVKHGPFVDEFAAYPVDYLPGTMQTAEQLGHEFHTSLDDPHGCPEPTGGKYEPKTFASVYKDINRDETVQLDPITASEYLTLKKEIETREPLFRAAKSKLLEQMGFARFGNIGGLTVTRRQPSKSGIALHLVDKSIQPSDVHLAATQPKEDDF